MIDAVAITIQTAAVWIVATILSSILSACLYLKFRRIVTRYRPTTRALVTLCFALISPAVGLAVVLIYLFPEFAQLFILPHCHGTQCGTHTPLISASSVGNSIFLIVISLALCISVVGLTRLLLTGRRRLATLFLLGERVKSKPDHLVLDSDQIFAWCCGLIDQRLVLSKALVHSLDSTQLEAVLAHEQAHADRFDNLRNFAARLASVFWLPSRRQQLLDDLYQDNEECCDAAAVRRLDEVTASPYRPANTATEPRATWSKLKPLCKDAGGHLAIDPPCGKSRTRPFPAYLLLSAAWSLQMIAAVAVSHPIVEIVAALGG